MTIILTTGTTEIDESEEWCLEIYSLNSQMLQFKKAKLKGKEYDLNTSGWGKGIYLIRIT